MKGKRMGGLLAIVMCLQFMLTSGYAYAAQTIYDN